MARWVALLALPALPTLLAPVAAAPAEELRCTLVEDGATSESLSLLQRQTAGASKAAGRSLQADPLPGAVQGSVAEIYSYGAPGTAPLALFDALQVDGCFRGLRMYTEDVWGAAKESKWEDAAAMVNTLAHARMATLVLRKGEDSLYRPCPEQTETWWPMSGAAVYAHWPLHHEPSYASRLDNLTLNGTDKHDEGIFGRARLFRRLTFKCYDTVPNMKQALKEELPGWRLVASENLITGAGSTYDSDPVWLAQNEATLECALVFTGTNNYENELATSIHVTPSKYCGFQVHRGYRDELWHITKNLWPFLAPKLAKCPKVTCLGHSMGGSLCEIFAACANTHRPQDVDYAQQMWTLEAPALLEELGNETHDVTNGHFR